MKLASLEPLSAVVAAWLLLGTLDAVTSRGNTPLPGSGRHAEHAELARSVAASPALRAPQSLPPAPDLEGPLDHAADPALIRSFLERHPGHPDAARLSALHDRKLRPCPGVRLDSPGCTPELPALAEGVLDRAERYLTECLLCRERAGVTLLLARSRRLVERLATEQATQRFESAFERADFARATQILADAAPLVQKPWLNRARKRLERRVPGATASLDECRIPDGFAMLVSPASPIAGDRLRVLAVSEMPIVKGELQIQVGGEAVQLVRLGDTDGASAGPPHYLAAEAALERVGEARAVVKTAGAMLGCQRFTVSRQRERALRPDTVWKSVRGWDRAHENLYAAFIELLFLAPENTRWHGFHEVTRDRARNLLHGHLGLAEDDAASPLVMEPDCADAPYYFRAYFAWKLGLPFGRHECRFGTTNGPPRCAHWISNEGAPSDGGTPLETAEDGTESAPADAGAPPRLGRVSEFRDFLRRLKDDIHARSLRTELTDTTTDLYPLPLTRAALRAGSVFTDPYGHTLTLVRWLPQTEHSDGRLLAVDAQPDGSLRIKRFWRGNFLFPSRHPIGGHGFKAFRPIVLDEGEPRPLSNDEISSARGYGNFSLAQSRLVSADFYATMSRLINPRPLPPEREYRELHHALHAQLELRVSEVRTAEELVGEGRVIDMPSGRAIFRTTGAWEALSTPCRDLRLLVGMDALLAFPEEAALSRRGAAGEALRRELERLHEGWARDLVVRYRRSDGSSQTLTLAGLLARRRAFELGYNPNDCAELRWGASEGSAELSTCRRRAPAEQRRKMQEYRHWFEKRYSCG